LNSTDQGHGEIELDQEADFLLHLSQEYLRFGFSDEALATLADVSEMADPEAKQAALLMQLQALHQKNDLPKLLSLGETLPEDAELPPHAAQVLASAYWLVGLKDKARQWLQKSFSYVPTVMEVREFYKAKPEISPEEKTTPTLEEVLELAIKTRLGYHFALENLLPVVWRCRPTTCCFQDQVKLLADARGESPEILKKLHGAFAQVLYHVFGVYTAFFMHLSLPGGVPLVKLYLGTDPALLDRVEELEELYWKAATPWQNEPAWQEIMEREADLLGYPECCSRAASSMRAQGGIFEKTALTQLLSEVIKSMHWPEVAPPSRAYYAFEFFPCSPRCPDAEAMGLSLENCYQDHSPLMVKVYKEILLHFNQGPIFWPKVPYLQRIEGFDERLESLLGDLGEQLAGLRIQQK
jgi:hypothetical protein